MDKTEKCIVCLGKPIMFRGHVHLGNEQIVAGFCEQHIGYDKKMGIKDCDNCYGEWTEEMGVKYSSNGIGFIDINAPESNENINLEE